MADLNSPTTKILGVLQPFTLDGLRVSLEHWSVGYPLPSSLAALAPGEPGLILIALGVATAIAGLLLNRDRLAETAPASAGGTPAGARATLAGSIAGSR